MPKFKCPYKYPARSRAAMVDHICSIGGYYSRHERYALEFNVKAYSADFSFDHIWQDYIVGGERSCDVYNNLLLTDPTKIKAFHDCCAKVYEENAEHLWDWGQEDACRSINDDDFHKILWGGEKSFDVDFALVGRCGGHLCPTKFEGHSLLISPEDLHDEMMAQETPSGDVISNHNTLKTRSTWLYWTTKDIRNLYMLVCQWEVEFTPERASKAVEEAGIWTFLNNIVESAWGDYLENADAHETVVTAAKAVLELGPSEAMEAFNVLCRAAGVTEEELA